MVCLSRVAALVVAAGPGFQVADCATRFACEMATLVCVTIYSLEGNAIDYGSSAVPRSWDGWCWTVIGDFTKILSGRASAHSGALPMGRRCGQAWACPRLLRLQLVPMASHGLAGL